MMRRLQWLGEAQMADQRGFRGTVDGGGKPTLAGYRLALVASLASAMLIACGGGGGDAGGSAASAPSSGGSSMSSNPSPQPSGVEKTGFVPAAPAIGEVLHNDAAALRPLRDEALWAYRGVRTHGASKAFYASFRQSVATAEGFNERISSPQEGGSGVQALSVQSGAIRLKNALGLPALQTTVEVADELRSPVRRDEQVTLIDRQALVLKDDLDNDKLPDTADIGAYSRVVGDEPVELPELGLTVNALRVDLSISTRLKFSSKAAAEAVKTVTRSTWYAPGLGIVRQVNRQAAADGNGMVETDERLQFFDGVATGLGLVPSAPIAKTGGSAGVGPSLLPALSATRSGDAAYVLSPRGTVLKPEAGAVLSVLDKRGRVTQSVEHLDLDLSSLAQKDLLPLDGGVAVVSAEPGIFLDPYTLENLRLIRFDAQGQRSSSHWLASGAVPGTLRAAADGQTVWVSWVEPTLAMDGVQLMVQAFDGRGNARLAPQRLSRVNGLRAHGGVSLAAAEGRVLVSWDQPAAAGTANTVDYHQALVTLDPTQAIATLETSAAGAADSRGRPVPRLSKSAALLTWYTPLNQPAGASSSSATARGVLLDTAARAQRAAGGGADNESLQLPAFPSQLSTLALDGTQLLWSSSGAARLRAEEVSTDRYLDFAALGTDAGPLALAKPRLQRLRDRSPASAWQGQVNAVTHILSFDDRWLILGQDGQSTTAAVLHRR
jgi:hypothetical protein